MKILVGQFELFANARRPGWTLFDLAPSIGWEIEEVALARAAQIQTLDRGQARNELSFSISRQHASLEAAQEYLMFHPLEVPRNKVLQFITQPSTGPEKTLYLAWAKFRGITGKQIGVRTEHTYSVIGGAWTKTAPTN